jgi:phosphomannomutase
VFPQTIDKNSMSGYKVYWSDGCQIRDPLDKNIADSIDQNLEPWINYKSLLEERIKSNEYNEENCCHGLSNPDVTASMADSYFKAITSSGLITGQGLTQLSQKNEYKPPKIAYSAMHGVGYPWAVRLFQTFGLEPFHAVPEQRDANHDFPTVPFPNPEEIGALDLSMKFASVHNCDIVLANDPDADRLAVAERCRDTGHWTTFTGDQIGTMLGHWIWESLGKNSDKVS